MAGSNDNGLESKRKIGFLANKHITKRQSRIMGAVALGWIVGVYVVLQCVAHPGWFHFGG